MFVTKNELNDMLQFAADVSGRSITEQLKNFYFTQMRTIDCAKVRDAFSVFASKGHFPTVNELLIECGYSSIRTRDERSHAENRREKAKAENLAPCGSAGLEKVFGEYTWEHRIVTESEQDAREEFTKIRNEQLERAGWKILSEDFYKCRTEVDEGKRQRGAKMFKMMWHCFKQEPREFGYREPKPATVATMQDLKKKSAGEREE